MKFGVLAKSDVGLNLGRRQLLATAVVGLNVAALCRASGAGRPDSKVGHNFLRPTGAISEREFLSRCVRCGQCVAVCPTNYIQPGLLEAGLAGLWAAVLNAQTGYCEFECSLCTRVMPQWSNRALDAGAKESLQGRNSDDRPQPVHAIRGGRQLQHMYRELPCSEQRSTRKTRRSDAGKERQGAGVVCGCGMRVPGAGLANIVVRCETDRASEWWRKTKTARR